MVEPTQLTHGKWRVVGRSVRGATHKRSGLPNQDALKCWPEEGEGLPVILAVSDGHGSAKYFRSHIGARLAVETALAVVGDFLGGQGDSSESSTGQGDAHLDLSNPTEIDRAAKEHLPKLITRRWLEAVERNIEEFPLDFDQKELKGLEERDQEVAAAIRAAGKVTPVAYGATLLFVAVTAPFILYAQLGDGDILIVTESGEVRRPIAGDERLMANETTSLCAKNAWNDFRLTVQATIDTDPPALILMSTDGYANSFRTEESFLQIGPDILRMVSSSGLDSVERRMESWLNEASQAGSGDDITLGIIRRSSGTDIDMLAQTASAALSIGHNNQTSLESVKAELTSTQELVREQVGRLDESLASMKLSQDTALQKNQSDNRLVEERLNQLMKEEKRSRRLALLGILAVIVVEIVAHIFIPRASSKPTESIKAAERPGPTATVQATDTPATAHPTFVSDQPATSQEAKTESAATRRRAPARVRAQVNRPTGKSNRARSQRPR